MAATNWLVGAVLPRATGRGVFLSGGDSNRILRSAASLVVLSDVLLDVESTLPPEIFRLAQQHGWSTIRSNEMWHRIDKSMVS